MANRNLPQYVDCASCDWAQHVETEERAKVLGVLHQLDKHPEAYRQETGKDPELMAAYYAEWIRTFRKLL